jgi:undecaprenyl-diphosphatase
MRAIRARARAAPRELKLLIVLGIAAAAAWVLALMIAQMNFPRIQAFDDRVLIALRDPENLAVPIGPHWLLDVARDLTRLGSSSVLVFVVASVVVYLLLKRRFALMVFLLVSTGGGVLACTMLKGVFGRTRPGVVPHLVTVHSASFPSGHSLLSAVVYLTLAAILSRITPDRTTKIYFVILATFLTVLIGLSRIYLGVHYPTDVLAGWVVGVLWAFFCGTAAFELQRRRVIQPESALPDQRVERSISAA